MARELPRGRFVEIPRAVHTLHEDNPEAVLAALQEFLGLGIMGLPDPHSPDREGGTHGR
jgi:hypothetical protein